MAGHYTMAVGWRMEYVDGDGIKFNLGREGKIGIPLDFGKELNCMGEMQDGCGLYDS